jgi:diaminopropionate ammonia-lyase
LKSCSEVFISAPDWMAARGMRILGNPLKGDKRIISGESGAVTAGILSLIACREEYRDLKHALNLESSSRVLLFSTEGGTDPDMYRKIVWDGDYRSI